MFICAVIVPWTISDGDEILFPDSESKSNRESRRVQRQFNPQFGGQMMNGQFGGQFNQQFPFNNQNQQFNQQNGQQNSQQNTQQNSPNYIPTNNVPMGATHYRGRVFVTVPRRRVGVPSTLNFIRTNSPRGSSPSYQPFPSSQINDLHVIYSLKTFQSIQVFNSLIKTTQLLLQPSLQADPNRIISVYRTRVDECNRLWWIDTGKYIKNILRI